MEISVSKNEDRDEIPPLLMSISIAFVVCNCCAMERDFVDRLSTDDLSDRSHGTISIFSDDEDDAISVHSFLTCCNATSSLPLRMRSDALHSANLCANDRPRPREAPVSKMDLSWNCSLVSSDRALLLLTAPILNLNCVFDEWRAIVVANILTVVMEQLIMMCYQAEKLSTETATFLVGAQRSIAMMT